MTSGENDDSPLAIGAKCQVKAASAQESNFTDVICQVDRPNVF